MKEQSLKKNRSWEEERKRKVIEKRIFEEERNH